MTPLCHHAANSLQRTALLEAIVLGDGVEIYLASAWDSGDTWTTRDTRSTAMQPIVKEGRCWVID